MKIILWKSVGYEYGVRSWYDWGLTGWGWLLLSVIVIALIVWMVRDLSKASREKFQEQCKNIRKFGYQDIDDIQVFLNRIDADLDDFIHSKGLRKQYEIFSKGETSNFINKAEAQKKSDDAEAIGNASGLATGIVVGSVINAGR